MRYFLWVQFSVINTNNVNTKVLKLVFPNIFKSITLTRILVSSTIIIPLDSVALTEDMLKKILKDALRN